MVDEVNKIAEADKANVIAEIVSVDKAIVVDRANLANEANGASLAEANKSLATDSIAVIIKYSSKLLLNDFVIVFAHICWWWRTNNDFTNSLTKYVTVFAKDKGYFGVTESFWDESWFECQCSQFVSEKVSSSWCCLQIDYLVIAKGEWWVSICFDKSNTQQLTVECITCLKDSVDKIVSADAIDSDNEDGVLDNQLAELEKFDVVKGYDDTIVCLKHIRGVDAIDSLKRIRGVGSRWRSNFICCLIIG